VSAGAATVFSVGLTGGIGSGKSTVANLFASRGAALIDTDAIAHSLTAPGGIALAPVVAHFGGAFLTADGAMNRAMMREHVFNHPAEKTILEHILHPLIRQEVERAAQQAAGPYLLIAVPLLVESGRWRDRVRRILVVDCPEQLQIRRVVARNGMTAEQVRAIMATQASRAERLAVADDVIRNDAAPDSLVAQVDRLHSLYCALAAAA
jgi:dephospho-CoA kinase